MRPEDVKIVFPLDVSSFSEAVKILDEVASYVDVLKIGHQFLNEAGNHQAIAFLKQYGKEIFVDCKLTDIPNSVSGGAVGLVKQGIDYINVMAGSGVKCMKGMVEAIDTIAKETGVKRPKIIAVTILTSLGFTDLVSMGFRPTFSFFKKYFENSMSPSDIVHQYAALNDLEWYDVHNRMVQLFNSKVKEVEQGFMSSIVMNHAEMAIEAGVDIVLSSPLESPKMHERWPKISLYSPGIRLPDSPPDDQVRTLTPGEAVRNGVQYPVIGRPIRNPQGGRTRKETIELIRADIAQALQG